MISSESGEKCAQIKQHLRKQSKTALCGWILMWEDNIGWTIALEKVLLWIMNAYSGQKWWFKVKMRLRLRLGVTSTSSVWLPLQDESLYVLPNCKSLWIKASAKWLNVNVNVKCLDDGFVYYKHAAFCFTKQKLIDDLEWCGLLVDYCDVFIRCLVSHSDGTHSLNWWASDVMLNFSKYFIH